MSDRPPTPTSTTTWIPVLVLTALIVIAMGLPSLAYPLGRDQGNYAYAAWEVLLGSAPYRDVFVFKPPGSVWQHAVSLALFGVGPVSIRAWDLLWTGATAAAIGSLVYTMIRNPYAAILSTLAVGVLYWSVDYWNVAQTDGWLTLPSALALWGSWQAARAEDRRTWITGSVLAGAGLAVAVSFKYTALGLILPMGVALVTAGVPLRTLLARSAVVGGAAAALTATWLTWIWGIGAWGTFWDSQADLVPQYVVQTARTRSVVGSLKRLFWLDGAWYDVVPLWYGGLVGLVGASYAGWRRRALDGPATLVLVAWWAVGLAGLIAQNKYFDYHFLALLGPSAALLGVALAAVGQRLPRSTGSRLAWIAALVGLVVATPVRERWVEGAPVLTGWWPVEEFWASQREFRYKDWNVDDQRELVQHLRETTRPGERVFIWGFEPAVNVWAQRRTVTRFLYNYPFRVGFASDAYEGELLTGLEARPPDVFVVVRGDATYGVTGNMTDSAGFLRQRPALVRFVESRYGPAVQVRRYLVRRLRPADPAAPAGR